MIFKHRYLQVNTEFWAHFLPFRNFFFPVQTTDTALSVTWGYIIQYVKRISESKTEFIWQYVSLPSWSTQSLPRACRHLWEKETSEDIRIAPPPQMEGLCHPRVNLRDYVKAW